MPSHPLSLFLFAGAVTGYATLLIGWQPRFRAAFETLVSFVSTVLVFVGISGAFLLCQSLSLFWQASNLNHPTFAHHGKVPQSATTVRPRVIWIVFDELSFEQVFERRQPDLHMPAFDALHKQGTVFTNVQPEGFYTESILPALLTGDAIDGSRPSSSGMLSVHEARTNQWVPFDQHDTIFQDALNSGVSTALAGWYNPYCRLLPEVLDRCFWTDHVPLPDGMEAGQSLASNMMAPIGLLMRTGVPQRVLSRLDAQHPEDARNAAAHATDLEQIVQAADQLLLDQSAGLVLLHLPVPHPPGIYNIVSGRLTTGSSDYIDNLALADRVLAHLRSTLERDGGWDASTVVIMGDHSWRVPMWRGIPGWTKREENASGGGHFDPRPAYIVKLPGQQIGSSIEEPFSALRTRRLLDNLLLGSIRSSRDLHEWAKTDAPAL